MDKLTILKVNNAWTGSSSVDTYTIIRSSYPISIENSTAFGRSAYSVSSYNNGVKSYIKSSVDNLESHNSTYVRVAAFIQTQNSYIDYSKSQYGGTLSVFYSDTDVYLNGQIIYSNYTNPSLSNTQQQLENLNFSNFIINANSYTQDIENNDGTLFMLFYNRSLTNSTTTDGLYPIKEKGFTKGSIYTDYENSTSDNMVFSFPIFMSGVYFNVGSTYEIRFAKKVYNSEYNRMVYEYFGEPIQFTISSNVTQDYINQLNQQTASSTDSEATQDLQNSIDNQTSAIENQTQSIDDINNSITNSNVDNSTIDLPTDNTQDPTQTRC